MPNSRQSGLKHDGNNRAMKADVIIWDYDGTLVNSAQKNINITKQILSIVAPHLANEKLPEALTSELEYHKINHRAKNWQDLYINYFGLSKNECLEAGKMWSEHQLINDTPVQLFPGIREVIKEMTWIPHGICSQNSSDNIRMVLRNNNLHDQFKSVIGYSDVSNASQKPKPASGLKCLEQIFGNPMHKSIIYIGDHEGDVQFARNLAKELDRKCKVTAIAATYSGAEPELWSYQPDMALSKPEELLQIMECL